MGDQPQDPRIAYRQELVDERLPRSLRTGAFVLFAIQTAFIAVDYLIYPERVAVFLPIRLLLNAILAAIYFRTSRTHPLASTYATCFAGGAMLLAVVLGTGGASSPYYTGLVLLFVGMPVLVPISGKQASWIVGPLIAAFAGSPLAVGSPSDWNAFLLSFFFLSAAGFESIMSSALLDGIRFKDFLQRRELEQARDELRELDRAKSRFTANLHHELRTPLTLMLAPLEGIKSGEFGELPPAMEQMVRTIHANGLRLLKLINNLLDLAKIESRELQVRRVVLDPARLVRDVVEGARGLAERKGVLLQCGLLETVEGFHGDPEALDKVLVNLVGNALKFTEPGGRIELSVGRQDDGVHVAVADTGAGIPADQLERIFDRFAQVDDSATRRHEGTGIGLSLVRELVELHGGRVWAESPGVGQGSTLHVMLPLGEADAEAEDPLLEEGAHGAALGRGIAAMEAELSHHGELAGDERMVELERNVERFESARHGVVADAYGHSPATPEVLIAEDNAEMRRLLVHLLGRRYRVRSAPNGRLALEAVREKAPDAVVTDVMMPELSGTELCRALKSDSSTRHIPVILVTSKAEREMKIEGLELGADDYVTKPFHPRELLARVSSLVRIGQLQADLAERNVALEHSNRDLGQALKELKEAEVQLVQVERLSAVGELAAGVAHEINNPLNFARNALAALRTYVEDLRSIAEAVSDLDLGDREKLGEQIRDLERRKAEVGFETLAGELAELVGITNEGLDRTSRLVSDLRDFAAPRAGGAGIADARRGVESTLQLVRHEAQEVGVRLESDVPEGIPRVVGDARALNQVFLNLLKNGVEALEGTGGTVRVRMRRGVGTVTIEVEDDGPGIDPALRDRLFEPFVTSKAAGRGTGLGLPISRRIVQEFGGSLELCSGSGRGSCFRVTLRAEGEDAG